ncbi:hypothetical protein LINPERPRIM_LOCUS34229 [Linum perenne]
MHTYREWNHAADYLTNLGHNFPLRVHLITRGGARTEIDT